VTLHIAVIQTKGELLNIPVKVLRAGVMIDPMQTTLQYRPNAFNAVCIHAGTGILTVSVVDRIMIVDIL
jgi:hypothetical protein